MSAEPSDEELREWASELYKDEDLDEECLEILNSRSNIYSQPMFKEIYASCKSQGRDGSDFDRFVQVRSDYIQLTKEPPSDPRLQITAFQNACLTPDFVWVDAMIRLGTDCKRLTGDGHTALSLTCSVMREDRNRDRITHPGRVRIIRRLLQQGVDPNIQCPLQHVCATNDLKVCEILLANGADPRERADDGRLPKDHLAAPLRRRFTKLPRGERPEPMCWCLTSGRLFKNCHGKEGGRLADASYGCPCKSGKTYGKCCKKRGIEFYETREQFAQTRKIAIGDHNKHLPAALARLAEGKGPNDKMFPNVTPEAITAHKRTMTEMLLATTDQSQFDPAFAYAFVNCDFMPTYWKHMIPKNERLIRQQEWNDAVDEYITSNRDEDDMRPVREIEECAKIGADGAALFKECAHCGAKEQMEGQFAMCSRCTMRAYCGPVCQKAHWREGGHKHQCGEEFKDGQTGHCPLDLPSQAVVAQMTDIMGEQLGTMLSGMNSS